MKMIKTMRKHLKLTFLTAYGAGTLAFLAYALLENNWNHVIQCGVLGISTFAFFALCLPKGERHP
jgi:hypothetical protein